jgi:hypothetical protein
MTIETRKAASNTGPLMGWDPAASSTPFDVEFNDFLAKALVPSVSENVSTSRTDIVLLETILHEHPDARTILDVCCGRPLLLEKLIEQIQEHPQQSKDYYYVGCDRDAADESFRTMWSHLNQQAMDLGFRTDCAHADAADPDSLKNAIRRYHKGSFDIVLFANALHEITPLKIPSLLFALVELLKDTGVLVVLDPDPAWLLDENRWKGVQDLRQLGIDWEAKAVWLPQDTYQRVFTSFGCSVEPQVVKKSQEFWALHVRRNANFEVTDGDRLIESAKEIMKEAISRQLLEQKDRSIKCRVELINELRRTVGRDGKLIRNKGVEFFSICTSQARRYEATIKLQGKK